MKKELTTASFRPIKVIDIELTQPIPAIEGYADYDKLQILLRLHDKPLGYLEMPLINGCCSVADLSNSVLGKYSWTILCLLINAGLSDIHQVDNLSIKDLYKLPKPEYTGLFPLVTVAVCTRNRPKDLKQCLDALQKLHYPNFEILVVDNAPSDDTTEELVWEQNPRIRYVRELKPGLSWARNCAIVESRGEIIAYTDDDVIVDPEWVMSLVKVFTSDPCVMAVTGMVVPYELETESQILFERHGGFGRGFDSKRYQVKDSRVPKQLLGGGQFGTGANMAYRRSLFDIIGGFNVALGAGTLSTGCEDHEMYFRVLKVGYALVYEPSALVRHRHRRNYETLRSQLTCDGIGLYSYFTWAILNCRAERWDFLRLALWWLWYGNFRRLWISLKYPNRYPRDLIIAELEGCLTGMRRYQKALQAASEIADDPEITRYPHRILKDQPLEDSTKVINKPARQEAEDIRQEFFVEQTRKRSSLFKDYQTSIAIRFVDISQPLQPISDVLEYDKVRVYFIYKRQLLGNVDIHNGRLPVSITQLHHAATQEFSAKLMEFDLSLNQNFRWAKAVSSLASDWNLKVNESTSSKVLRTEISVSIIVSTYDRPDDLRNCLKSLVAQESPRYVEIIVVDNHPDSGLTPPVVAEFSNIILLSEPRQGLAYGRNTGIINSTGEIVVATDDDVTMSPQWLERLLVPFTRPDVMIVTGNILPLELKTLSQQLFESYGGLGRGFEPFEVNGDWFEQFPRKAVPTWTLGATANAAFRATIFSHPHIGLMDEALGPGMPSGVGEDTYLFYKVLKAGYTLVYQPYAFVWHKHRQDMDSLRHQLYNYSKGHVAYHLTTLLNDGDFRALVRILVELPLIHLSRIYYRLRGWTDYPISLVLLEVTGNFAGSWSLWVSRQRVKRTGRRSFSDPVQRTFDLLHTASASSLNPKDLNRCQGEHNDELAAKGGSTLLSSAMSEED